MKRNIFSLRNFFLLGTVAFFSCNKEIPQGDVASLTSNASVSSARPAQHFNTFYGPQTQMGDGMARSFIILSHDNVPVELGIEMTSGSLTGLSTHDHDEFQLALHQKAMAVTAFDHIGLNWNPHGHPPEVIFGNPHFDFHFYTITKNAQTSIPAYTPGSLHDVLPENQYWPVGHVPLPGGEAGMGKHWADILRPIAPGGFTHTMIYGSYNGEMIFVEPMITLDFLQSLTQKVSVPYNQPAVYMKSNTWYPTVYNMYTNQNKTKYYVTLGDFIKSN